MIIYVKNRKKKEEKSTAFVLLISQSTEIINTHSYNLNQQKQQLSFIQKPLQWIAAADILFIVGKFGFQKINLFKLWSKKVRSTQTVFLYLASLRFGQHHMEERRLCCINIQCEKILSALKINHQNSSFCQSQNTYMKYTTNLIIRQTRSNQCI